MFPPTVSIDNMFSLTAAFAHSLTSSVCTLECTPAHAAHRRRAGILSTAGTRQPLPPPTLWRHTLTSPSSGRAPRHDGVPRRFSPAFCARPRLTHQLPSSLPEGQALGVLHRNCFHGNDPREACCCTQDPEDGCRGNPSPSRTPKTGMHLRMPLGTSHR